MNTRLANLNPQWDDKDKRAIMAWIYKREVSGKNFKRKPGSSTCNKKCFTETAAELIVKRAKFKRNINRFREESRYYYCEECKAYHLTSQEKRGKTKEL